MVIVMDLPIDEQFVEANGLAYRLDRCGPQSPTAATLPTLVLLHGFTGSRQNWRPHLAAFATHFQVVAIDLLGHGETAVSTTPARYQIDQAAADLVALIEQIATPPVHLIGYSMGGRLALYFAHHYPRYVSKLILESASPGLKTELERTERQQRDNALADFIEEAGITAFVNRWQQLPLWHSQAQLAATVRQSLRQQRLGNTPTGLAHSLRGMGSGIQPGLWSQLPQIAIPTLLLCGALDQKFVAINQEMAAALPNAQLAVIPQAGHTVHLERPFTFQHLCLNFLTHAVLE